MPHSVDWGRREYADAHAAMKRMRRQRRLGEIEDTLILVEHPPVVTIGVEGDDGGAEGSGFPVVHVERGGKSTYHGPGQLVGYPIVDLQARGRDVRRFVHDVEEIVIRSVSSFGITSSHVSGRRGVWVGGERKIASVGIAVEEWVTYHGFALNVDLDLSAFEKIHPCGFDGRIMTSIGAELGRPVLLPEAREAVLRAWTEVFDAPALPPPGRPVAA